MKPLNEASALVAEALDAYSVIYARETGDTWKAEGFGILGDRLRQNAHESLGCDLVIVEAAALRELVELAEEGWGYAEAYFHEKWGAEVRLAKARAMLGGGT